MSKYVFLVGRGIGCSLSPAMQGAAAAALGLDWEYKLLETGSHGVEDIFNRLTAPDCLGANITVPFKEKAVDFCHRRDQVATRLGAVNTIVNRRGELWGYNTDPEGLARDWQRLKIHLAERRITILGAGGSASAVLSLCSQGEVSVVCRRQQQGQDLIRRLESNARIYPWRQISRQDLVINCTPPQSGWQGLITTASEVYDLNYTESPSWPHWHNGLGMLLFQGAAAFHLWTGLPPPLTVMARTLGLEEPL